jgi:hypothetical protein
MRGRAAEKCEPAVLDQLILRSQLLDPRTSAPPQLARLADALLELTLLDAGNREGAVAS